MNIKPQYFYERFGTESIKKMAEVLHWNEAAGVALGDPVNISFEQAKLVSREFTVDDYINWVQEYNPEYKAAWILSDMGM